MFKDKISEHIFAAKLSGYCVYHPLVLKIGEYPRIYIIYILFICRGLNLVLVKHFYK